MPFKHIAYWLSDFFEGGRPPLLRRLKSTSNAGTTFPTAGSASWTDLGPNLQSAFLPTASFSLEDVQTSPSNNEHVIVIGESISGGFPGIALSKDAGDTWVNPSMPLLAAYTTAAQNASSGIFASPFDMTAACAGFLPSASNPVRSVHWFDDNNIFVAAGPFILKCSNWTAYVTSNTTPVFQVVSAIYDTLTPDTQAITSPVACPNPAANVKPPVLPIRSVYFETSTKGICATDIGVFITNDGGLTWVKISDDEQFQAPFPIINNTINPWDIGEWAVRRILGVHINGPNVVVLSQNYLLRGVYNPVTLKYDFQPIRCADAGTPASAPYPAGQCCPCPISSNNNVWRSLNWYKNSIGSYTYYATGTNNKIYRSSNNGASWAPWVPPDTAYSAFSLFYDYQDISFYSPTNCFFVFGDGTSAGINKLYTYDQSFGVSDSYTPSGSGTSVNPTSNPKYMAVWVGTNPVEPEPAKSYTLTNCDSSAQTQILCSQSVILAPYVGQVITGINWALTGTTPPSPLETTDDCWTVTQNPITVPPCPPSADYVVVFGTATAAYPFDSFSGQDACEQCLPPPPPPTTLCLKLVNCEAPYEPIYINIEGSQLVNQFSGYIGYVISIPELCSNKCLFITTCDPTQEEIIYVDFLPEVMAYQVYPNCAECKGLPPPTDLHPRRIKPGFYTPGCPPEYTVKTYCAFAEQAYDEMVLKRYGVEICCDHDIDKWDIRKQILELKALYDECLCVSTICPKCVEPCNVSAEVIVYNEIVETDDPPPPCIQPDEESIDISLGNSLRCFVGTGGEDFLLCSPLITSITIDSVTYDLTPYINLDISQAGFNAQFLAALDSIGYPALCSWSFKPTATTFLFGIYGLQNGTVEYFSAVNCDATPPVAPGYPMFEAACSELDVPGC